jgi:gliding motility-associated-like protein
MNVNPLQDSTFVFVVYYKHCLGTDTIDVNVNPLPNIKLPDDTSVCINDFITIKAENGVTYLWNNGKTSPSITEEITAKTQFSVIGYDDKGCKNYDIMNVGVYPLPEIELISSKTDYCIGDTILIIASGAETYYWLGNTSDSIIEFIADNSMTLYVEGVDSNSCVNSNNIDISLDDCVVLYFPNSFTPDGDGLNDVFKPDGDFTGITNYSFSIFNRWGEQLFRTKDFEEGWDGYYKGRKKAGVYVYKVKYKTISGTVFEKAGTVILLL